MNTNNNGNITLCLNMIVKNESRIIKRLLETVSKIIDYYVICDTGSTDNTPHLIIDFFTEKGIQGEVIYEPFKNFGYNRTFALQAARNKATYALLVDADMKLVIEPTFDKQKLTCDSYTIIQKGGSLSYYNTRLIKLNCDAKCLGPTHEYYDMPPGLTSGKLDTLWINDIGDGGSKGDKFERDILLLKQGIIEEPNNGRYYFYLANSYFNSNQKGEAIEHYKKRIELGGWYEEIFYSYLNLGHSYMAINQPEMGLCAWMDGYNHHSTRSETIYEICRHYREKGKNKLAMIFCNIGLKIPYPSSDVLFIHEDVYQWKFSYELCIVGFYNGITNLHKSANKLFNMAPESIYQNTLSNYKFYSPKLSKYLLRIIPFTCLEQMNVCDTIYEMRASTPCIFQDNRGGITQNWLNVRYVNYYLESNGSYRFNINNGKIVTVNKLFKLDSDFKPIPIPIPIAISNSTDSQKTTILKLEYVPTNGNMHYVGIEDVKVNYVAALDKYMFVGTCENPVNGNISIGYGEYNFDKPYLNWKTVDTPFNKGCEKNWAMIGNYVIYQWHPLIIGEIDCGAGNSAITTTDIATDITKEFEGIDKLAPINDEHYKLKVIKNIDTPPFFKHVRGSSNGFLFEGEAWFLCHIVEYCQPREYYHFLVVLDNETFNIKRWSNLFKFAGEKIEYALGLIINEKEIIISYSKWDRDASIGIFDKKKIEDEMFDA